MGWKAESRVEVYLRNKRVWLKGTVRLVFYDSAGEWLLVDVGRGRAIFELNRFDECLRRPKSVEEMEADVREAERKERAKEKQLVEEALRKKKEREQEILDRQEQFKQLLKAQKREEIASRKLVKKAPAKALPTTPRGPNGQKKRPSLVKSSQKLGGGMKKGIDNTPKQPIPKEDHDDSGSDISTG